MKIIFVHKTIIYLHNDIYDNDGNDRFNGNDSFNEHISNMKVWDRLV